MTATTEGFDLGDAGAGLVRVATAVSDAQLDAVTPCENWSLRQLLAHAYGLSVAFTATARHVDLGPPPADPQLPPGWRESLPGDIETLVTAWRDPAAWEGMSHAGGITMPAPVLAAVALDELTLHAWDIAVSTGQAFEPTTQDVAICTGFAEAMSTPETLATREGLFGPLVAGHEGADGVDRLLRLAGRDPDWRPGPA